MDTTRFLPALISAVVMLIVFGSMGLLALSWTESVPMRLWIRRGLFVLFLLAIGGPFIYWLATWGVEGSPRSAIDRSMQQQQNAELRQRIQNGGH
jgi:hypothetical protein